MKFIGVDPSWSVKFALKWCDNRDWVHLNTSPLSALFRNSGAIIGLGIARLFDTGIVNILHRDGTEIVTAAIALAAGQICAWLPLPLQPVYLYYGAIFVRSVLISVVAVVVVPYIVKDVMNLKEFPSRSRKVSRVRLEVPKRGTSRRKITADF